MPALVILTQPIEEPITLAETKLALRIEHDIDDSKLSGDISSAREEVEKITHRQLISAQYRYSLDCWPLHGIICPPRARLISVESIKYIDNDGILQTLDSSAYTVDTDSEPGRIVPAWGETWPSTRQELNAVRIEYTAGYANAAAVPHKIKQFMIMLIGAWQENPSAIVNGSQTEIGRAAWYGLLDDYIVNF